jgi:hypothetical protein
MGKKPSPPLEIFFSYARADRYFLELLKKHLSGLFRAGLITVWDDSEIKPGTQWAPQLAAHIGSADIILMLVSPDYLASEFLDKHEMKPILQRHDAQEVLVIPVFLRPVALENTPLARLQGLPLGDFPVTKWANKDEAFRYIARGIERAVRYILSGDSTPFNIADSDPL